MLHIKLIKSTVGHNPRNRATVTALGLRKIRQVVYHEDTPTIRGMIHHVKFLLDVTEGPAPEKTAPAYKTAQRPKTVAKLAPGAGSKATAVLSPIAEVTPKAEAKPKAEPKPKVEPKAEAKPKAETKPKVQAKAATDKPKPEAKPKAPTKPKVEPTAKATTKKAKESSK